MIDKETVVEGAKAIQEAAKTAGQGIEYAQGLSGWVTVPNGNNVMVFTKTEQLFCAALSFDDQ